MFETEASEAVADRRETTITIEKIRNVLPAVTHERARMNIVATSAAFEELLAISAPHRKIHAVFRAVENLVTVYAVPELL